MHHNSLLMSLLPIFLNLDRPLPSYYEFFTSNNFHDIETTTFALQYGLPQWAYQTLPKNNSKSTQVLFLSDSVQTRSKLFFTKLDPISITIDMIINEDKLNKTKEAKKIPVKHFLIDMRHALLKPKLLRLQCNNGEAVE